MKLSIIILNYNTPKLIKYLLKNIYSLELAIPYEIILIDNSEAKDLKKEVNSYITRVKLFEAENRGYAAGNNIGISHAQGEYVLILNPDIYLHKDDIEKMLTFMDQNQSIGLLGPKLIYPNGEYQYSCLSNPDWRLPFFRRSRLGNTKAGRKWLNKYLLLDYDHLQPKKVEWLFGACFLARKKAIHEVGSFDDRYFMYFEDLDWCRRFWQKKWEVWYYPKVSIIHFHHRDSADRSGIKGLFTKLGRVHLVSYFKYMWKWRKSS